jgi:hypothetical protein
MRKEYSGLDSSGTESGSVTESCEHGFEILTSLLTVHLSIILAINQLNAQNLLL